MSKIKLVVFTGAGVSQESGISTFRDLQDGLWYNYKVEDVASMDGWRRDPQKVLNFYNERKSDMGVCEPNLAHKLIADLEKIYDVVVLTQNVDTLHEEAGSTNVIHLHGRFDQKRSSKDNKLVYPWGKEKINIGDLCPLGSQLRPNIVFFGDDLNQDDLIKARKYCLEASACIIVGTSLQVYPAAELPFLTKEESIIWYVDPGNIDFYLPSFRKSFFYHIKKKASVGMLEVVEDLKKCNFKV
jgi:NAD-dependent deacetylase